MRIYKGVKLFHLFGGKVKQLGDIIKVDDCGGCDRKMIEKLDYVRLNKNMDIEDFLHELERLHVYKGKNYINQVIYITNEGNKIIGIIPINYNEDNT
jgi:hypothetical protein